VVHRLDQPIDQIVGQIASTRINKGGQSCPPRRVRMAA
jgi:hypothetical protein